jgi:hypothetical protein
MAIEAWPYVVTRGRETGYQAILVPRFLEEADESYVLEYASRGGFDDPGIVAIRDIIGSVVTPLAVAYRVSEPEPTRYGFDEATQLEDEWRRPIRVFEGLAITLTAKQIQSNGLELADFDAVARQAVPAFHRLWLAQERIDAKLSAKIIIGSNSPLACRIIEPYVIPGNPS